MNKRFLFFLFSVLSFALIACQKPVQKYEVSFVTGTNEVIETQILDSENKVIQPLNPTKEGHEFIYWYVDDESVPFDFNQLITEDLVLSALWDEQLIIKYYVDDLVFKEVVLNTGESLDIPETPFKEDHEFKYWYTNDENMPFDFGTEIFESVDLFAKWQITEDGIKKLIQEDIEYVQENLYKSLYQINLFKKGNINNSSISWIVNTQYINSVGVIVRTNLEDPIIDLNARFYLDGVTIEHTFEVDISIPNQLNLDVIKNIPFQNLTTEYDVLDGSLNLYFENEGNVPYVKLNEFINLLQGFIDPNVEFVYSQEADIYTMSYQYYDETEDYTYDLVVTIDITENTISVNDPGFFWAYIYSTETNYGRNIKYMNEYPGESNEEGSDIIFDLDNYGMDATEIDSNLVLPYYVVNQLFAGSSYYNVYFNHDALYGIYSTPSDGSDEYNLMKTSSVNGDYLPEDLIVHNFNMLAFNLDHFYGLREIRGIDTYYDLLFEYKNQLLSSSAKTFDTTLFNIIYKVIDEPHTSYGVSSYYNDFNWGSPSLTSLDQLGERYQSFYNDGLYAVDDAIYAKWKIFSSSWAASTRPKFWFVDDAQSTVVLSLDDFLTSDIQETTVYDANMILQIMESFNEIMIPEVQFGEKYFYYNSSSQEDDFVEILIKGATENDYNAYKEILNTENYEFVDGLYRKSIDNKNVVVSLLFDEKYDALYIGMIEDKNNEDDINAMFQTDMLDFIYLDSAVYMEFMLDEIIEESPLVRNIVLDITFNLGGNVGALYRVIGFMTDQPFRTSSISLDTGSKSSNYIDIENSPSYEYLNWALLTSPVTFSAGNALATIFMENELGPILGLTSGGGTASITPVLLPNGTTFTMSSNNLNAYRTGLGTEDNPYIYYHNEYGIVPDYSFTMEELYDNEIILNSLEDYYK